MAMHAEIAGNITERIQTPYVASNQRQRSVLRDSAFSARSRTLKMLYKLKM
ncbi:MAG TPA: hypothetical protein VJS42_00845 [Steroidobacteraceae bacterium]|nr:hypothetical protein [Steroidobacteraceae bacterium]